MSYLEKPSVTRTTQVEEINKMVTCRCWHNGLVSDIAHGSSFLYSSS
jgi:hypothetical protein